MTEELFSAMRQSVIDGDPDEAEELAREALAGGIDPISAIDEGYVPGIRIVGESFRCGEMFLPDMMASAVAMQKAIAVLEPEMLARASQRQVAGRVVIGTVKGDIHEIGKNIVGMMLTANGFEVHDLGVNVMPEQFVAKVREVDANVVGVSALLTTTMTSQRAVITALADAGLRDRVKVIVGGAPVTRAWADEIGKNIVGMMLTANGFEVHDLGVNVMPEQFVDKVREVDANVVGVSALLTTTMTSQRAVITALADAGLRDRVKVIVGGAPVTRAWADEIGADGYGEDAVDAVSVTQALLAV